MSLITIKANSNGSITFDNQTGSEQKLQFYRVVTGGVQDQNKDRKKLEKSVKTDPYC